MSCVNHELKSIFIHVAKCGGSSLSSFDWNQGSGHDSYSDYESKILNISDYFTWSFVRNPWVRAVSAFEDCPEIHDEVPDFKTYINILYKNKSLFQNKKFTSYGSNHKIPEFPVGRIHFWPSALCLKNKNGDLSIDFIGKLENLEEDFKSICDKLNIKNCNVPHKNQRKGKKLRKNTFYKDLYNDSLINQVGEIYSEDIELFNYSFD
jgi:hypothetical protein|tara:strand:- start:11126 stop:11746 length:621 start_codon:yes stop_codon:yes gene_type:complete